MHSCTYTPPMFSAHWEYTTCSCHIWIPTFPHSLVTSHANDLMFGMHLSVWNTVFYWFWSSRFLAKCTIDLRGVGRRRGLHASHSSSKHSPAFDTDWGGDAGHPIDKWRNLGRAGWRGLTFQYGSCHGVSYLPQPCSPFIGTPLCFVDECRIRFASQVSINYRLLGYSVSKAIPISYPQSDCQGYILHSSELHQAQFGSAGMHCAHWALCK